MSEPGRHTAPTVLDIPVSVTGLSVLTDPLPTAILPIITVGPEEPTEIYSHFAEIPEPIPHEVFATEDTNLITLPSYDYSFHEQVERDLQVRLVDLEAFIGLQDKYGSINILIDKINSDLLILGRTDRIDNVEEF